LASFSTEISDLELKGRRIEIESAWSYGWLRLFAQRKDIAARQIPSL